MLHSLKDALLPSERWPLILVLAGGGSFLLTVAYLLLVQCAFLDKESKPQPKQAKPNNKKGANKKDQRQQLKQPQAKSSKDKQQKAVRSNMASSSNSNSNSGQQLKAAKSQLKASKSQLKGGSKSQLKAGRSSEGMAAKSKTGGGHHKLHISRPSVPGKQPTGKNDEPVNGSKVAVKVPAGKTISDLKVSGKKTQLATGTKGTKGAQQPLQQKSSTGGGLKILANKSSTLADSEEVEFKTELFDVEPSGGP